MNQENNGQTESEVQYESEYEMSEVVNEADQDSELDAEFENGDDEELGLESEFAESEEDEESDEFYEARSQSEENVYSEYSSDEKSSIDEDADMGSLAPPTSLTMAPRVAIVGRPNVGKSTLMNLLSKSNVFAENKLFATLDTTTRKVVFENTPFLLSDTVGFIHKLPHHLIESFKSTLDEVREADVLLHVVDIAHPRYEEQMGTVNKTLQEINAFDKPMILVFNKMDLYEKQTFDEWLDINTKQQILQDLEEKWNLATNNNCVFVSAAQRTNMAALRNYILKKVRGLYKIRYPYKTEYLF